MPKPSSGAVVVLATVALGAIAPATADGAARISGTDGQVWNAASPVPVYEIDGDRGRSRIYWQVQGVVAGVVRGRATVTLPGLPDGDYRLLALQDSDSDSDSERGFEISQRTFRVDVTAPVVSVASPVAGAQIPQGSAATVAYTCEGAVRCEGSVPAGARLDTSLPGPASLSVRAVDDAGNVATKLVDYVVVPLLAGGSAQAKGPPRTLNALALRPRVGVRILSRRPTLRWRARPGAALYNVQLFRLRDGAATKVLSAFPRRPRYRVPAGRLAYGGRYLWRVWPQVRGRYLAAPLGLSYFDVTARPVRR